MRLHTLAVGSAVTVLALSGLAASTASATPADRHHGRNRSRRLHLDGPLVARADGIKLKINEDATVRNLYLDLRAGRPIRVGTSIRASSSPWSSPGRSTRKLGAGRRRRTPPARPSPSRTAFRPQPRRTAPAVLEITADLPELTSTEDFRQDRDKPKCRSRS